MKFEIIQKSCFQSEIKYIVKMLPVRVSSKIYEFIENNPSLHINEIRIRADSPLSLIADFTNIKTDLIISENDITEVVMSLCKGSLYSHFDTIKDGYISVGRGIRAGICGRAITENGNITAVCDITSVNIRVPQRIPHASDRIFELLKSNDFKSSVILYSPPGVGKTTILRDLIVRISHLPHQIRTCVIDTREEITPFIQEYITSDIYISYPKGEAIELATKSMTPELIICDEISSEEDADAILKSVNSGVNLIATAHAKNFDDLKEKLIISKLLNNNIFDYALGVKREYGSKKYEYELSELKRI